MPAPASDIARCRRIEPSVDEDDILRRKRLLEQGCEIVSPTNSTSLYAGIMTVSSWRAEKGWILHGKTNPKLKSQLAAKRHRKPEVFSDQRDKSPTTPDECLRRRHRVEKILRETLGWPTDRS